MDNKKMNSLKKIDNKWIRLFALIIVAVNSGAMMMGIELLPFTKEEIVTGVSLVAMVGVETWNHWKNNSYTEEAKQADNYYEAIKNTF